MVKMNMNMPCFLWGVLIVIILCSAYLGEPKKLDTAPTAWPEQFHSMLFINNSGALQVTDLWYDWPKGRNFNIIQKQLGRKLYDLEWNNGTSFYYYLDKDECKKMHFDVGILKPNWLEGAKYLGMKYVDGFLCNGWEKVDFIWYYEDALTNRPVHWRFFSGMSVHVITFEAGAVLEDAEWQAPLYCFDKVGAVEEREKAKSIPVKGYAPLFPYFHKRLLSGFNEHNIFTIDS